MISRAKLAFRCPGGCCD